MVPVGNMLRQLESLDFTGKGEAWLESRFLTPLLDCLGYETHKDYEVFRHGDNGASFKLNYPPVGRGAVKVKHYAFIDRYKDAQLPLLNQVECALLRLTRKANVLQVYQSCEKIFHTPCNLRRN